MSSGTTHPGREFSSHPLALKWRSTVWGRGWGSLSEITTVMPTWTSSSLISATIPDSLRRRRIRRGPASTTISFSGGTCLHFLLRNDGGRFTDVAGDVRVVADRFIPPSSVDPTSIYRTRPVPTGLGAYDFGFGTTFFDYDNDGAQDLYWLGGLTRGEGPGGHVYPSPGRMLRGDGAGSFRDITVAAHLLDIADVNYVDLERKKITPSMARVSLEFHENGKGLAHGDLNRDGFVDLIGTNSSGDVFTDPERVVPGSTKIQVHIAATADDIVSSTGSRAALRLDKWRRTQSLDHSATTWTHGYRRYRQQRRWHRRSRNGEDEDCGLANLAGAGPGSSRRFQLPLDGQHRPRVRPRYRHNHR